MKNHKRRDSDIEHSVFYYDGDRNHPLRREEDIKPPPEAVARVSPFLSAMDAMRAQNIRRASGKPSVPLTPDQELVTLTDAEIGAACSEIWLTDYQDRPGHYDRAIARAVIKALDKKRGLL